VERDESYIYIYMYEKKNIYTSQASPSKNARGGCLEVERDESYIYIYMYKKIKKNIYTSQASPGKNARGGCLEVERDESVERRRRLAQRVGHALKREQPENEEGRVIYM